MAGFFVYSFFLDIYIRLSADTTDGPAEMQPMKSDSDYNSDEIFPSTMNFRHVNSNPLALMQPCAQSQQTILVKSVTIVTLFSTKMPDSAISVIFFMSVLIKDMFLF